jgi:hypothetical protein
VESDYTPDESGESAPTAVPTRKIPYSGPASDWTGERTTFVEDEEETNDPPKHFKMMCNLMVNGKRASTNSKLSKSIVKACAEDGIHLTGAYGRNGEVWNCVGESDAVRVGDIAHMYHGDLKKGKHFVGKVLSTYERFSDSDTLDEFPHVKEVWPDFRERRQHIIFCRVAWKEVAMTARDEYMLKHPGKNGFKVQGTILRIR